MTSAFVRRLARAIRLTALWGPGDRVAVAVSGGADSVALLLALAELRQRADWQLAGVIHVNHQLRGAESDDDARFTTALAGQVGAPIEVIAVDVAARRRITGESTEAAARALRYDAFAAAARVLGASVVATAHTLDDQAETVLLRLLRGTSARGLGAIRPRCGIYARPLLHERRHAVVAYLAERGQEYRTDLSNFDSAIPRNRIRDRLTPVIDEIWPGGIRSIARAAAWARDDEAFMSEAAAHLGAGMVHLDAGGVELDRGLLVGQPGALARRLVRDAIEAAGGRPTTAAVQAVLHLARSRRAAAQLSLPGVSAKLTRQQVAFAPPERSPVRGLAYSAVLPVPGEVVLGETAQVLRASIYEGTAEDPQFRSSGSVAWLQASQLTLPLTVRARRAGDRLRPLGAPGTRRLQDVLVDRKIPREERDRVPIVEDHDGRIVWVAGVCVAEHVRVTRAEGGVVILKLIKDIV